ncbi:MAG TPA: 3-dehydroquinate synthase [Atribacteraceae bacterium]|nr:3-dehydroquinate synthase [Atribacteraceae bacterium]
MRELRIVLRDKAYSVLIDQVLFASGTWDSIFSTPIVTGAIITNATVARFHLARIRDLIRKAIPHLTEIVLPDGEEYKTLSTVEAIYHRLAEAGLDRRSVLIALGGGVITDMTGFAASTYLRGIPYYQVPTSLLAQVDSSVGGKTGVNLPAGKNLVGTFYQPEGVLIDLSFLRTLPAREFREGLSEVAKAGFLAGGDLFALLKNQPEALAEPDGPALAEAVALSIDYKRGIVEQDERESGIRAVLNYGHTLGHALERAAGYGALRHGEAVAMGMAGEALVGVRLGLVDSGFYTEQAAILRSLDLPVKATVPVSRATFFQALWQDKKREAGHLRFALVERPGKPLFGIPVTASLIDDILPEMIEVIEP